MPNKSNREFNELIEKVYEQKFDYKNYRRKLIEEVKTIPSFFYNASKNQLRIELKEDEVTNHSTDLEKFYDNLQNIQKNIIKELIIEIDCDENIASKVFNKYTDLIRFVDKPNSKYYTKKYFKEKMLVELQALEDILEYTKKEELKFMNVFLNHGDLMRREMLLWKKFQ